MKEAVLLLIAIGLVTYDSASNAISVHHINHFALQPVRSSLHLDTYVRFVVCIGFPTEVVRNSIMCIACNSRS